LSRLCSFELGCQTQSEFDWVPLVWGLIGLEIALPQSRIWFILELNCAQSDWVWLGFILNGHLQPWCDDQHKRKKNLNWSLMYPGTFSRFHQWCTSYLYTPNASDGSMRVHIQRLSVQKHYNVTGLPNATDWGVMSWPLDHHTFSWAYNNI